jgi:hypothetical protein
VNRLLRISLPGGDVERERTVGRRMPARDTHAFFRLNLPGASVLAPAPDGRTVLALIRKPAPGGDSVAVVDAATLEIRCRQPLEDGVRYSGLLLGNWSGGRERLSTRSSWAERGNGRQPVLAARPKGVPSESLQTAHDSPGWMTVPCSAVTDSRARAMSSTSK